MPTQPNKKITLLQVLPELESGGVERGTIEIAKAAHESGINSLVTSNGGRMASQVTDCGATHIKLPLHSKNPLNIYRNIKNIEQIILEHNVDIVHARSRAPAWSAYFASKNTGCKFVTTFHGSYSTGFIGKKFYNSIMTRGCKTIAISNFIKEHIQNKYHIDDDKITLINRGVDMDFFNPDIVSQDRIDVLRKKWRIEQNYPVIFMPGRITRWKGQQFLLNALSRMKTEKYYCVIAGSNNGHDKYYNELSQFILHSNLEKNVRIVDAIDDMPAAYKLSTIVVSPSQRPEAFGRVAIEAQAMGKLIVATALGGSKETIIDKETGRLVNHKFSGEMAEALDKALSLDATTYQQVQTRNRQHIKDNFSADMMCNKTIALYKGLLSE